MNTVLIGCGRVAQHYKKIFKKSKKIHDLKIIAVCDLDLNKSNEFSNFFNSRSYTNIDKLYSEEKNIDTAIILTPSGMHFEHCKFFLEKSINVICEKPTTMNPDHSKELTKLCKDNNVFCATVYQNRWNPTIILLKEKIAQNELGKILIINVKLHWCRFQEYYEDGWHGTWKFDGGVLNQQAIHHIDAMRWIFGPVTETFAIKTNLMNKLEAEDSLVATIKFENGALGTIDITTAVRPDDLEASISVIGTKGNIKISGIALNKIDSWHLPTDKRPPEKIIKNYSYEVDSGYGWSHEDFLAQVLDCFKKNITPEVNLSSAIETQKVIHAIYASTELNKPVYLKDNPRSKLLGV